jgi:hypothetical protein
MAHRVHTSTPFRLIRQLSTSDSAPCRSGRPNRRLATRAGHRQTGDRAADGAGRGPAPCSSISTAEHPIHPVSTAISTSRQQTTLRGYNQHARRPRPRTTCPPPLEGTSTTGTPATAHRPGIGHHPLTHRLSRCRLRGSRFHRPRRPAKATAAAVTASNPAIRTSARIVTGAPPKSPTRRIRVGAPAGWTALDTRVGAAPDEGAVGRSGSGGRNPDQKILPTVVIDNVVGHADDIEVQRAGGGAARTQRPATKR